LRYVTPTLAHGLFEKSRGKNIRYNQYSMPWPVMGPIFSRTQTVRKLASFMGPAMHISKSTCSWLVLPYLVREMINERIDPVEFALANFNDKSVGESLAKEIERAKGIKR
jgi:replication factor C large subunit